VLSAALQARLFARAENKWSHGNIVLMGDAAAGNSSLVCLTADGAVERGPSNGSKQGRPTSALTAGA